MVHGLRHSQRLVAPLPGLVRIAKYPQDAGQISQTGHLRIMAIEDSMDPVLFRIKQDHSLFHVGASHHRVAQMLQVYTQR
jgi:hypothetical protein